MQKFAVGFLGALLGFISVAKADIPTVKIDGSSSVYPITEAVAEEYQKEKAGKVHVTVQISGTGGGFKKFCTGETDIQDASRPIQAAEMKVCETSKVKYYEIPVAFDAMAIVVSPENNWLTSITVEELKKMWQPEAQGKITKWNQINPKWPDLPLKLYGAGTDSGTFDYFTEAIVGKAKASRGDYMASEDDNTIVQGIKKDKGGLGYIPFSYFNSKDLKLVAVDGGTKSPTKKPVLPSEKSVVDASYYPLSRPLFVYVNEASAKKPEVKEFVEFYLKNAEKLTKEAKYIPLPPVAYKTGGEHFAKGKIGTVFGGHTEVGMKIEDLLKREAKTKAIE